jgi:hypothetical protein
MPMGALVQKHTRGDVMRGSRNQATMKLISLIGLCLAGATAVSVVAAPGGRGSRAMVAPSTSSSGLGGDPSEELRVPPRYRTSYQFLGSWAIAADQGHGAKELHFVYASPGTITAYRKTGHFPDGSILVKEVFRTVTVPMTTGTVSRADALKGWFVMVRDSRNRHASDKLWGNGWGWGWFDAGNPSKTTSKDFTKDCQPCHVPAQSSEWVYVGGYPPLNR